jgi:hypothetical protein
VDGIAPLHRDIAHVHMDDPSGTVAEVEEAELWMKNTGHT